MPTNPPVTYFHNVPNNTVATALDSLADRQNFIGTVVDDGGSNPWDFGTVDISMLSSGVTFSGVRHLMWRISDANGNTNADNFKFWLSNEGLDQAASVINFQSLTTDTSGGTSNNSHVYVINAITTSYGFADNDAAVPASQNINTAIDAQSITLSAGVTSEAIVIAAYFDIANDETTGTYEGTDTGYELQCSLRFDYN